MKQRLNFSALSLLAATMFLLPATSNGRTPSLDIPQHNSAKEFNFSLQSRYLSSKANYTSEGGVWEELPNGQYYRNLALDIVSQYTWTQNLRLSASAGFAYAKSSGPNFERTNSTPTEIGTALRYNLFNSPLLIATEARFLFPINRVSQSTDKVLTGEGALAGEGGLWISKNLWALKNFVYTGVRYRDEGRSNLLPWRIGSLVRTNTFLGAFEAAGYKTITDDKYTNNPAKRHQVIDRVNGGSRQFYSVNPEIMELRGWIGFKAANKFMVKSGFGHTINGKNAAHGWRIYLTVDISSSMAPSSSSSKDFEVKKNSYDKTLFQESKSRQQKKRQNSEKSVEDLLNETEKDLD